MVRSSITCRVYNPKNSVRVVDPKQQMLYMKHNLTLLDIYYSDGDGEQQPRVVMIFDKEESYPLYKKWMDRTLE